MIFLDFDYKLYNEFCVSDTIAIATAATDAMVTNMLQPQNDKKKLKWRTMRQRERETKKKKTHTTKWIAETVIIKYSFTLKINFRVISNWDEIDARQKPQQHFNALLIQFVMLKFM